MATLFVPLAIFFARDRVRPCARWFGWSAALALLLLSTLGGVPRAQAAPAQQDALPPETVGVDWDLVSLQPTGGSAEDTSGLGMTLRLEPDGSANGSGGCNRFITGFTAGAAQSLTFSVIGGTLIGCEPAIATREASYFKTLQEVTTWSLANGQLRLESGASGELIYTSKAVAATAPTVPPAQLPATGGDGLAPLWMVLLAAVSVGVGCRLRRAA